MALPHGVKALIKADPRMTEFVQEYSEGTPLRLLEIRIKGSLGKDAADSFTSAFRASSNKSMLSNEIEGTLDEKHGLLGDASWATPKMAARADDLARPGYDTTVAHEYLDTEDVLKAKVALLAQLVRKARRAVVYAGAGLSTASGVGDYATRFADNSVLAKKICQRQGFILPCSARPNLGHRVVAAMARAGCLWRVVQQNHDGLLQKAGVSQKLLNEIHGSWFDPSNPVVKMTESVRDDLYEDTCLVDREADLVLVLGSSLAGMNADRIVRSCARRALQEDCSENRLGTVIVSLQRTPHDAECSLRIFATIDDVMALLAKELLLELADDGPNSVSKSGQDQQVNDPALEDVFSIPYDVNGRLVEGHDAPHRVLDLRDGAELIVTSGADKGQKAVILGRHPEGHYKVGVQRAQEKAGAMSIRHLGQWWVHAALAGEVPRLPLVSA